MTSHTIHYLSDAIYFITSIDLIVHSVFWFIFTLDLRLFHSSVSMSLGGNSCRVLFSCPQQELASSCKDDTSFKFLEMGIKLCAYVVVCLGVLKGI